MPCEPWLCNDPLLLLADGEGMKEENLPGELKGTDHILCLSPSRPGHPLSCLKPLLCSGTGAGMTVGNTAMLASIAAVRETEEEVAEITGLQETATVTVTGLAVGKLMANWQQGPKMRQLTRASLQQPLSQRLQSSGPL